MHGFFDTIVDRRGTDSLKWDKLKERYGDADLLPFWVADMDFRVMPQLAEAIAARAAHPSYGYSFASKEYYQNFIDWNSARNQYDILREEILSVPGVVCASAFIIHALVSPGGKVMFCSPVYTPFYSVTKEQGRQVVTSSLRINNGRYEMDWADIEAKLAGGVELLILSNPHNPIGRVWSREELKKLGDLCLRYGVIVFSDDIHSDLIMPGSTYTPLPVLSEAIKNNTVLAMAPSKTFNIAGLNSSYLVIANPTLRKKVHKALQSFHLDINLFGLKAAEAAYGAGAQWVGELTDYLLKNAQTVVRFCAEHLPRVKTFVPEGTYLMWLDFSDYRLPQAALMQKLQAEAKVALNDGSHYGPEGIGFARLNIGTSREMLLQGLAQIASAFASVN
ncbi:MAG: PatB family C-S lyase [Christensenellaceae bacterium]|jgi:cystathionine beta-lyase|nr:PatB family C-S lyase [Christensenellaceae bacterium]